MVDATHQWSGAPLINSSANRLSGDNYRDRAFPNSTFDTAVTDPPPGLAGYRVAFWSLVVDAAKSLNYFGSTDSDFDNSYAGLWYKSGGVWQTALAPSTATRSNIGLNLTPGVTYYAGCGFATNKTSGTFSLAAYLAAPVVVVTNLTAPPVVIAATIGLPSLFTGPAPVTTNLTVPPIAVIVGLHVDGADSNNGGSLTVPPIAVTVGMPTPAVTGGTTVQPWAGTFDVVSPVDDAVVATATPDFTVAVDVDGDDDYTVQFLFADNTNFTNPTTMSGTFNAVDGGIVLTPTSPLPSVTYWKARLSTAAGVEVASWLDTRTLTVATAAAAYSLPITWTVSTSAARPIHLWHIDPAGPNVNDVVTIYGQGFPAQPSAATLTWGGTALTVTRWELVEAVDENDADNTRLIDGDTVTCEHYEVEFTAPKVGGGLLELED